MAQQHPCTPGSVGEVSGKKQAFVPATQSRPAYAFHSQV